MSYPQPQKIEVSAFEAPVLILTMKPAPAVAWTGGTTFILNVCTPDNQTVVLQTTAFTIQDYALGIVSFALSSSQTGQKLGPGTYAYDVWRTDAGNEKRLAYGPLTVLAQQWQ